MAGDRALDVATASHCDTLHDALIIPMVRIELRYTIPESGSDPSTATVTGNINHALSVAAYLHNEEIEDLCFNCLSINI